MLKLADYICLGEAKHKKDFIGLRLSEKIRIGGNGGSYIDVILSGVSPLVLTNAIELNYLKLFGGTEQSGTPTPDTPIDIVCNNGVVKVSPNLFDITALTGSTTVSYSGDTITITGDTNVLVGKTLKQLCPEIEAGKTYYLSMSDNSTTTNQYIWLQNGSAGGQWNKNTARTLSQEDLDNGVKMYCTTVGQTIVQMQIEQGTTATPYRPYGQIYTDGTTETVEITGKNLFNPSAITENKYISNVGEEASDNSYAISDYIYVAGANKITISTTDTGTYPFGGSACKAFYDVNKNYISNTATQNSPITATNPATITIPSGAVYFRTSVRKSSKNTAQVEYGDIATTFEAYTVLGTATAENLLKVGNYKDEQEVLTGSVTRNVGIKVFDGTEGWGWIGAEGHAWRGTAYLSNFGALNGSIAILTHFSRSTIFIASNNLYIRYLDDYNITSLETWKQYLAQQYANGTPVIIVYPLATSTTETVTGQPLTVQSGTNTVTITQASIDDLEMEVSYKQSN